jgi:hypothetical protein
MSVFGGAIPTEPMMMPGGMTSDRAGILPGVLLDPSDLTATLGSGD